MWDEVFLKNVGTLQSIPDCYKNQTCNETVDNYAHQLEFAPDCYKTPKMSDKVIDTYPSAIQNLLKAVDSDPFLFAPVLDQFKNQEIGVKLVSVC